MNSDHLSDWLTFINSNRPNEGDFGLERLEDIYSEIVQSPLARKTILVFLVTFLSISSVETVKLFSFE